MQVVEGGKYELCMQVNYKGSEDEETVTQFIKVVVYRNLNDSYSLSSWSEDCAGS